jgi:hypothetical protein
MRQILGIHIWQKLEKFVETVECFDTAEFRRDGRLLKLAENKNKLMELKVENTNNCEYK